MAKVTVQVLGTPVSIPSDCFCREVKKPSTDDPRKQRVRLPFPTPQPCQLSLKTSDRPSQLNWQLNESTWMSPGHTRKSMRSTTGWWWLSVIESGVFCIQQRPLKTHRSLSFLHTQNRSLSIGMSCPQTHHSFPYPNNPYSMRSFLTTLF